MTLSSTQNYYNWLIGVKDIVSWSTIVFETYYWKNHLRGSYVSPGSAETLVRRGGIKKQPFDSVLCQTFLPEITKIGRCELKL